MTEFKYDGDLEGLNSIHFEFISKTLNEQGFAPDTVIVKPVGEVGDNYQSTVKRLTIKDLSIIAKIAPTLDVLRKQLQSELVFKNETLAYEVLLPKYAALQQSVGIENPLKYAKCYGILKEKPNELILLEDLNTSGHNTLNRLLPLTDDCIRVVIKNFALFHALSFVLKEREPAVFKFFCDNLRSIFDSMDEMLVAGMQMAEEQMLGVLDNEEFKEKVNGFMLREFLKYPQLEKEDSEAGKTVIIQGDAWTNNILFKFENDKATSCIMIDYQLTRQANPLTDLNYLIFNCSDYQTRTKHYHSWVNMYYKELTKILARFNIDSEDVYTRETMDNDMKRYSKIALATSLMFNGFVIRESEEVFDFKKAVENNSDAKMDDLFAMATSKKFAEKTVLRMRERLTGLIQSFIDLGYL